MKLSNRQLVNSVDSLRELSSLKLPVKTSFKLAKLTRLVDTVLKDYRKTLEGLQEEFAEKDSKGDKIVIGNIVQFDDKEAFDKAFQELLDCENTVEADQISIEAFGSVEVEPSFLYHLDWLIIE